MHMHVSKVQISSVGLNVICHGASKLNADDDEMREMSRTGDRSILEFGNEICFLF
jgi:hypothetical protein